MKLKMKMMKMMKMMVTVGLLVWSVSSDMEQDRAECTNQLIGLSTCLPYVGGDAKAPTRDCCVGIKEVLEKSAKCICVLVKDRNDPKLGVRINATRALILPSFCHQPNPNASLCVSLLHLTPNSPEAKEFESLGKLLRNATASTSPSKGTLPTATQEKSDGGKRQKWLGVELKPTGYLLLLLSAVFIINLL